MTLSRLQKQTKMLAQLLTTAQPSDELIQKYIADPSDENHKALVDATFEGVKPGKLIHMDTVCDVATEFEPVDWFTMQPSKWCGNPAVYTFVSAGQLHGVCQEHLDGMKDGCQIVMDEGSNSFGHIEEKQ